MEAHPKDIKFSGQVFIQENAGNIKDFYKITSCIGRGKLIQSLGAESYNWCK